jgi:hypothetical protein
MTVSSLASEHYLVSIKAVKALYLVSPEFPPKTFFWRVELYCPFCCCCSSDIFDIIVKRKPTVQSLVFVYSINTYVQLLPTG